MLLSNEGEVTFAPPCISIYRTSCSRRLEHLSTLLWETHTSQELVRNIQLFLIQNLPEFTTSHTRRLILLSLHARHVANKRIWETMVTLLELRRLELPVTTKENSLSFLSRCQPWIISSYICLYLLSSLQRDLDCLVMPCRTKRYFHDQNISFL
jgi:hypothetical protein